MEYGWQYLNKLPLHRVCGVWESGPRMQTIQNATQGPDPSVRTGRALKNFIG
jgi:hypothetical protein